MKDEFTRFPFDNDELGKIAELPFVTQKILLFIMQNAHYERDDKIAVMISRTTIAESLCVSVSTVKRSLTTLKEKGLIGIYQTGGFNVYVPSWVNTTLRIDSSNKKDYLSIKTVLLLDKKELKKSD